MQRSTRVRVTLYLAVMAWLMVLPPAHAYIDGGSMTVLFQAIVAGMAAAGTAVAVYWTRIKNFFRRGDRATTGESSSEPSEQSPEKV